MYSGGPGRERVCRMSLAAPTPPARDQIAARGLRISVADGCTYSLMIGVSESFLGPMAVELGHGDTALALLLTVPMLAGSLVQLLSGPLTALLGARKRLVVIGAALQAVSVLGLYFIAAHGIRALWPLLLADTLYFMCAMIVGPPWGSWMAALTEGRKRERYFAQRSAYQQVALLFAYVAAGFFLHGAPAQEKLEAFALLHLWGFAFRVASTGLLAWQPDLEDAVRGVRQSFAAVRTAAKTADFRVPAYMAALMLGAHLAVPFFTPYMLRELRFDYATYAGLTAIAIVTKALAFPFLHPISERFGMRRLLFWSGCGVVVLPSLWGIFDAPASLAVIQAVSGVAWAGVEYASYQLLLGGARDDCRVEFLSLASTMTSSAQLMGGLSGGLLRTDLGLSYTSLFHLSTLGRAIALAWILGDLPRKLARGLPQLFLRVISVRPGVGAVARPIVDASVPPPPPTAGADKTEDATAAQKRKREEAPPAA
jgi:MFS family permease